MSPEIFVSLKVEEKRQAEMRPLIAKGMRRVLLERDQRWEMVNKETGEIRRYVLEEHKQTSIWERLARLRNIETGGIARIYCDSLEKGDHGGVSSWYWRLAS